ncbi:uncharacterized protein METZ01_LOCUS465247, partial [marine metagenome]
YVDGVCETCESGAIVDNDADDDSVCDGDEVVGCTDNTACNYNASATDSDNSTCTYAQQYLDCNGVCLNDADGDGVCDENEVITVDVLYDSDVDIAGFQFDITGADLVSASGGDAAAAGLSVIASTNNNRVLAYSASGAYISAGSGVLTTLTVSSSNACIDASSIVWTDQYAIEWATVLDDNNCLSIIYEAPEVLGCTDSSAFNYNSSANTNDGTCYYPSGCDNTCGSTLENDECGVCGGDGIADGACD